MRLLALIMFACVAVSMLVSAVSRRSITGPRPRTHPTSPQMIGVMILFAYLAIQAVLLTQGEHTVTVPADIVAAETRSILGSVAGVGIAVFAIATIRTKRMLDLVLVAVLVGISFSVIIGLIQGIFNVDYRGLLVPPGFDSTREIGIVVRNGFTRVNGTSEHPIEFAVTVAALLPIALHYFRFGDSRAIRGFAGCVSALLLLAVPASVSRSAIVTLIVAGIIYLIAQPIRVIVSALSLLVAVVGVYYVVAPDLFAEIVALFTGASKDVSITTRTDDYKYVGDMFRERPWLGHGLGSDLPKYTRFLDNQWLQLLIVGGVLGVAGLLLFIGGGVIGLTFASRLEVSRGDRDLVFALAAAFAAILVSTTVFDLFSFQQAFLLLFLLYGLIWSSVTALSASSGIRDPGQLDFTSVRGFAAHSR
ncbi:O-antigen ligase family protein [Streptomyces sp. SID6673]|nr:O-antigen ligase family protein [Streptomyces sp. SID11726]NEB27425.1 O-antigen ligase family protein [Streptomyces sp. SID6673]